MSYPNEYPKMLYSPAGAQRVVQDKDAEDAQLAEWGVEPEVEVIDLPAILPITATPPAGDAETNGALPQPAATEAPAAKPRIGRQKKSA